jgi:Mn-dependent DtxR family transcriptional regulator
MAAVDLTEEQEQALRATYELARGKPGVSVKTRDIGERLGWDDARVVRVMSELEALDCAAMGTTN